MTVISSRSGVRLSAIAMLVPVLVATVLAQQRDTRVAPVGAGQIAGVVVSAGATPEPVRRAIVTIAGDLT
jgi:hypothetical protein